LKFSKERGLAIILSIVFTLGLMNAIFMVVEISDQILSAYNPDPWPSHPEYVPNYNSIVETLTPVGYFAFFLSIILIILGFVIKRFKLSFLGAISLYLPIFANFAFIMFTFAGIGLIRIIWVLLLETNTGFLMLGDIILLPEYFFQSLENLLSFWINMLQLLNIPEVLISFFYPLYEIITLIRSAFILLMLILTTIGMGIFIFSVLTWLYGKFKGQEVIDFWIYKYSRHPQYLGFLISTYGLTAFLQPGYGAYIPNPTFFWVVTSLILIAIAIREENVLLKTQSRLYISWRKKTPFLFYLPNNFSFFLLKPVKRVIAKEWPETDKEILITILIYGTILIILSIMLFLILEILHTLTYDIF
jgi:protein-S-isoprenylcysteine O-methyltransferase Ste14